MADPDYLRHLLEHYQLKLEDCNTEVTDKQLLQISLSCCKKWRLLYPLLDMKEIDVASIGKRKMRNKIIF